MKINNPKHNKSKKIFINISCFYAMMVFAITFTMTGPILIEISNHVGRNIENMGIIFSFLTFGFILGAFSSSFLYKYISRKKVILFFYLLLPVSVIAIPFSLSFIFINIAIFFMGLSGGFIEAQVSSLVVDINRNSEGLFINLTQIFFGIGAFIGPFLSSFIVSKGIGWKYSYIIVSILCIFNFAYFIFLNIPEVRYRGAKNNINNSELKDFNKNTIVFLILILAMFFYVCGEMGITSWLPTFLRLDRGFSGILAGRLLSFFWLSVMFGRLIIGFLTKRLNMLHILISITFLAIFSILIGIYSDFKLTIIISFIFSGLLFSGIWPLVVAIGGVKFPMHRNLIISLLTMIGGIGGLFSPWLIGKIYRSYNLFYGMNLIYIFLTLVLIFLLILFFLDRNKKWNRSYSR